MVQKGKVMKFILRIICWPWHYYKDYRDYKKRLNDLKKNDPFIYK